MATSKTTSTTASDALWEKRLKQMQQLQSSLSALSAASNASPDTMLGFALGKLLGDGFKSWKSNYEDRDAQKATQDFANPDVKAFANDLGKDTIKGMTDNGYTLADLKNMATSGVSDYTDAVGENVINDMVNKGATANDLTRWSDNYHDEVNNQSVRKGWNDYVSNSEANYSNGNYANPLGLSNEDLAKMYPGTTTVTEFSFTPPTEVKGTSSNGDNTIAKGWQQLMAASTARNYPDPLSSLTMPSINNGNYNFTANGLDPQTKQFLINN